jgi:hypothetical protein
MPDFSIKLGATQPVFTYQCIRSDGSSPVIDTAELVVGDMNFDMDVDITDTSLVTYQFTASDLSTVGTFPAFIQSLSGGEPEVFPDRGVLTFKVEPLVPDARTFAVTPSPTEVAQAHLMARTRDTYGKLLGRFTDDTSITYPQALAAIDDAYTEVMDEFGSSMDDSDEPAVKRVITLLAACNMELDYFPEQSAQTNSPYDKLYARYTTAIEDLRGTTGEAEVESAIAFAFPPPAILWNRVKW